jgi:hypothetical protein
MENRIEEIRIGRELLSGVKLGILLGFFAPARNQLTLGKGSL